MRLLKQLEFAFERSTIHPRAGRDVALETAARDILRQNRHPRGNGFHTIDDAKRACGRQRI